MERKTTSIFNPIVKPLTEDTAMYLNGFCCGVESLDGYVPECALADRHRGSGVTYLFIDNDLNVLVGYYTLSCSAIPNSDNIFLSAVSIDMFAISKQYQDMYIESEEQLVSDYLLWTLIGNIYKMSERAIGARFVILHAIPTAVKFYDRNLFFEITEDVIKNSDLEVGCTPMAFSLFNEDI